MPALSRDIGLLLNSETTECRAKIQFDIAVVIRKNTSIITPRALRLSDLKVGQACEPRVYLQKSTRQEFGGGSKDEIPTPSVIDAQLTLNTCKILHIVGESSIQEHVGPSTTANHYYLIGVTGSKHMRTIRRV